MQFLLNVLAVLVALAFANAMRCGNQPDRTRG